MSNPIPPFVCCTPPPIDCTVDAPPPVDDDFGDFAAVDDQFEVSSLPATPVHSVKIPEDTTSAPILFPTPPSPDSGLNFIADDENENPTIPNNSTTEHTSAYSSFPSVATADSKPYIIEASSPPPLDLESVDDDLTPCDVLDNDDEPDEFPVDDMAKYDDNISLPSLKFDSLSNISKSTTPVSEELVKSNHEDVDSMNAFQPISSTADLETEGSLVIGNEDEQEIAIPFEALSTDSKIEWNDESGNLSEPRKQQEDDFTEFEAFPAAPSLDDVTPVHSEPPDVGVQPQELKETNDFAFEADFSQFSSFEPAAVQPPVTSQILESRQLTERSSLDDLEADDFDDFQDFTVATPVVDQKAAMQDQIPVPLEKQESSNSISTTDKDKDDDGQIDDDDDDDDEFGEFSEVVESNATNIPSSNNGINLANLNDKLKPILAMMFPIVNAIDDDKTQSVELITSPKINQIDTAKALEYQWNNSEVRHSLIKSLGVDSRNILYGEKWNSSMPRYAANLSFNPLEPMKPDKIASGSNSNSNRISSTQDYRKRSESLTSSNSSAPKADVPAAEFDWNSSGLVNPLDASQAHTLLLDLDQLVVVANLDKINLDSSCSSPCIATSSSSSPLTSTFISTVTSSPASDVKQQQKQQSQSQSQSDLLAIDVQPLDNDVLIPMSSSLASPSAPSSSLLLPTTISCNSSVFISGTCRTDTLPINNNDKQINDIVINNNCTTTTTTTTTTNIFANLGSNDYNFHQYLDCRVKEILHERTIEAVHATQPGESHSSVDQQSNSAVNGNDNIYDSDKSLRGFVDKEAISTAVEFKSNADASAIVSATPATSAITAAIPSSSTAATATTATTTAITLSDDYIDITCGDFDLSAVDTKLDAIIADSQANHNNNIHTAKYQESSKTDLETDVQHAGVVTTSTYAGPLKETHIFTPSKSDTILTRSTSKTPRTSESKCPIDFDYEIAAAGIIIDEAVVKKEYRDLEYNPGFGSKYREDADYNHRPPSPDIECGVFGLNGSVAPSYLAEETTHRSIFSEKSPDLSDFGEFVSEKLEKSPEKKAPVKTNVPKSNSFDDEFSDFQSVPAPVPIVVPPPPSIIPASVAADIKSSPSHLRKLKEGELSATGSRTGTPVSLNDEMILSPAILLPQAIQMESKPKIEWPEPGINPEELARIEELFPQPKVSSNKQSPSHSSRSQQPQPSKPATQSAGDDDDWSDFVSVPAASNQIQSISQQFQQRKQTSPAKTTPDPNEEEWSDFVFSAPQPALNHIRPSAYPQFNSAAWQNANFYNNPLSAYATPPTSFYYQPPQSLQQQQQQNLSNNLVPNLSNINNNTATNNNIINNNSINQYLINHQATQSHSLQLQQQQHIQMMRDFSTASPMDGGSLSSHLGSSSLHHQYAAQTGFGYGNHRGNTGNMQSHAKSSQFGGGSSKIAPSISLIPDLGFVAPTHTSFISVPKNTFITKK